MSGAVSRAGRESGEWSSERSVSRAGRESGEWSSERTLQKTLEREQSVDQEDAVQEWSGQWAKSATHSPLTPNISLI